MATAIRHGCSNVTQLEIMPKPPLTRQPNNPWPEYPKVLKTDYGQWEAIALLGKDPRKYVTSTKRFVGDNNGWVTEVHTVEVEWRYLPESDRLVPVEIQGSEAIIVADIVLLALGFTGPEEHVLTELGVEQDGRSYDKAEEGKYKTNIEGIFAAGDMRRGQSLVVWAIDEGRQAAREVDIYLMGASQLP